MKRNLYLIIVFLLVVTLFPSFAIAYKTEDVRLAIAMIERSVEKANCYSYYCVSADDAGFWLSVTQDGVAREIAEAKKNGNNTSSELWSDSRQSVIDVCDSMYNFIRNTMEIDNKIFGFFVLDDTNRSNVLLVAISSDSGTNIVYDALTE